MYCKLVSILHFFRSFVQNYAPQLMKTAAYNHRISREAHKRDRGPDRQFMATDKPVTITLFVEADIW